MRFSVKQKYISATEADQIIESYYEGLSTASDEKKLKTFLSQKYLPPKYAAEQALFVYFTNEKPKVKPKMSAFKMYRSAAAAVLLLALFAVKWIETTPSENFAIVDGVRITNNVEIKNLAQNSLNTMSGGDDLVSKAFENLKMEN